MKIKAYESILSGVWVLEPLFHEDSRGYFYESFNQKDFQLATSMNISFVQDNHSNPSKNVLR